MNASELSELVAVLRRALRMVQSYFHKRHGVEKCLICDSTINDNAKQGRY